MFFSLREASTTKRKKPRPGGGKKRGLCGKLFSSGKTEYVALKTICRFFAGLIFAGIVFLIILYQRDVKFEWPGEVYRFWPFPQRPNAKEGGKGGRKK